MSGKHMNGIHGTVAFTKEEATRKFWEKVHKTYECWEWIGALHERGYGFVRWNGRTSKAHRVAWELEHGAIAGSLYICHRCDNPRCVRPDHLFVGTQSDNMRDMARKGRTGVVRGSQNSQAKLRETQVQEIRLRQARGETKKALAREFGVSSTLVRLIVQRKAWSWVA